MPKDTSTRSANPLLPVATALDLVLADAAPLPAQDMPLNDALGHVLAEDLAARRTQPPDAVSAMDGYAVRAADLATIPARLTVIGEVPAGHPFPGTVGAGQAARIFTGGIVPAGSDTVVIQEHTHRDGDTVIVEKPTAPGRNIRRAGLDFTQGQVLLKAGQRLGGRHLMLAAAMNYPAVKVHRMPIVAILGTGDELVPPGTTPAPGQIV
jgi:molybdopterin molybdotransferase